MCAPAAECVRRNGGVCGLRDLWLCTLLSKLRVMLPLVRKIILLGLLMLVPMQGMAAVVGSVTCSPGGHEHVGQAAGDSTHDHGLAGHTHGDHSTGSNGIGDASGHQGCHHMFSAVPVSFGNAAPSDLPVFQTTLLLLATLHFPEL